MERKTKTLEKEAERSASRPMKLRSALRAGGSTKEDCDRYQRMYEKNLFRGHVNNTAYYKRKAKNNLCPGVDSW